MKTSKNAVHFGAGNIGRGFIALLLSKSGYNVVFADVQDNLIRELNARKKYTVEILGENRAEFNVSPVSAIHSDSAELSDAFLNTDLVTTAVGSGVLRFVAPSIAAGISNRRKANIKTPLNVIACENMIGGSSELGRLVKAQLRGDDISYASSIVGFPDAAVDRIVPPGQAFEDPLRVGVEEFSEWIVDGNGFKGVPPEIEGIVLTDKLTAYLERKLFTLNTGHAATAYLGFLKECHTIDEAISDPEIKDAVINTMAESGEVLIRRHGFDRQAHEQYIKKILMRFSNPALIDNIARVARQPLRKLGYDERLIKPLRGTLEFNTDNDALIRVIAAALAFRHPDDEQSLELGTLLSGENLFGALSRITGMGSTGNERAILTRIAEAYELLATRHE